MLRIRQIVVVGGPEMWGRRGKAAVKQVMREVAGRWHRMYMRRHFQPQAYARYGYRRRSYAYVQQKKKRFGVDLPFVWGGLTRRLAVLPARITGTSKRTTARVAVGGYINRLGDMRFELVLKSRDEVQSLRQYAEARYHFLVAESRGAPPTRKVLRPAA